MRHARACIFSFLFSSFSHPFLFYPLSRQPNRKSLLRKSFARTNSISMHQETNIGAKFEPVKINSSYIDWIIEWIKIMFSSNQSRRLFVPQNLFLQTIVRFVSWHDGIRMNETRHKHGLKKVDKDGRAIKEKSQRQSVSTCNLDLDVCYRVSVQTWKLLVTRSGNIQPANDSNIAFDSPSSRVMIFGQRLVWPGRFTRRVRLNVCCAHTNDVFLHDRWVIVGNNGVCYIL